MICELPDKNLQKQYTSSNVLFLPLIWDMSEKIESIRICLVDDHEMIRTALASELQLVGHVIAAQSNGQFADKNGLFNLICESSSELLVIDINLGKVNGLDLIEELQECLRNAPSEKKSSIKILVLSMAAYEWQVNRVFELGAMGYVLKGSPIAELIDAVRWVHKGRRFYCRELEAFLHNPAGKLIANLSTREHQVLRFTAQGKNSFEIGAALHLSPKTVDTYRQRIMSKLGIKGRVELITFSIKHGYLQS